MSDRTVHGDRHSQPCTSLYCPCYLDRTTTPALTLSMLDVMSDDLRKRRQSRCDICANRKRLCSECDRYDDGLADLVAAAESMFPRTGGSS